MNGQEKEDQICGELFLDPSPGRCTSPFCFFCEGVLGKAQHLCIGSSTILAWCILLWLLFISKSQPGAERRQDLRTWNQSKQKRQRLLTSWQKRISSTALHSGKFRCGGAGIAKGSILKVIKFLKYLVMNKKLWCQYGYLIATLLIWQDFN